MQSLLQVPGWIFSLHARSLQARFKFMFIPVRLVKVQSILPFFRYNII